MFSLHPEFHIMKVLTTILICITFVYGTPIISKNSTHFNESSSLVNSTSIAANKDPITLTREARLILPQEDNNGTDLGLVQQKLELQIVDTFGGFSSFEGFGGWKSNQSDYLHHERVWYYDIAVPDNENSKEKLISMAVWVRIAAKQESVYLRLPNGEVTFV